MTGGKTPPLDVPPPAAQLGPEPRFGTPEWTAWRRQQKAQQLADAAAAARRHHAVPGLPEPVAARGIPDAELQALQDSRSRSARVELAQEAPPRRGGTMEPIPLASALPQQAQAAAGRRGYRRRERMWSADLRPARQAIDVDAWRDAVFRATEKRQKGDPSRSRIKEIAAAVARLVRTDDRKLGFFRATYETMRDALKFGCFATIQAFWLFVERCGLVDVLWTRVRWKDKAIAPKPGKKLPDAGQIVNDTNAYLLRDPSAEAATAAEEIAVAAEARNSGRFTADSTQPASKPASAAAAVSGVLERAAKVFGLHVRPWGLNTRPLRPYPPPD